MITMQKGVLRWACYKVLVGFSIGSASEFPLSPPTGLVEKKTFAMLWGSTFQNHILIYSPHQALALSTHTLMFVDNCLLLEDPTPLMPGGSPPIPSVSLVSWDPTLGQGSGALTCQRVLGQVSLPQKQVCHLQQEIICVPHEI